jgi:sorbitol/mannitol transport system permease protein
MAKEDTMATKSTSSIARVMLAPSVALLFIWMIVPLVMTLWLSFQRYNPANPARNGFVWFSNYSLAFSDPAFFQAIINTLVLVVAVLAITVIGGILLAMLLDQPMWGQGIVRILVISPFFVMPPVAALIWKNMIMSPDYGVLASVWRSFGLTPVAWLTSYPLFSIIVIVAWQWLPFATLILLTALQSLDGEQKEAAEMDGAGFLSRFWYLVLPHLARSITVVILMQMIFLLGIYAEIAVTTGGGPGFASTNLPFQIAKSVQDTRYGLASAGGILAVIFANIVAIFLMRAVGKNLDR